MNYPPYSTTGISPEPESQIKPDTSRTDLCTRPGNCILFSDYAWLMAGWVYVELDSVITSTTTSSALAFDFLETRLWCTLLGLGGFSATSKTLSM